MTPSLILSTEKFFEMKKAQCKEVVEAYRKFLTRQDGVNNFLSLAEVSEVSPHRKKTMMMFLKENYDDVLAGVWVTCRGLAWTRKAT